jgi:flagellar basal-body rod protein FlgB
MEMKRISRAYRSIDDDVAADNRQHLDVGTDAMLDALDKLMQFQTDALKLRSYRQELLSANIANSDTPNYKSVDFDFAKALTAASTQTAQSNATSDPKAGAEIQYRIPAQLSIDGNSVEMDAERAKFADNTVRYEAAMTTLTAQIKTMLAALQG